MNSDIANEIYSSRELHVAIEKAYEAFANPVHLEKWWGPEGFTNTIHEFDLRPNGRWVLTMHGPTKGNYENSSVFTNVVPNKLVAWSRLSQPIFDMEVQFERIDELNCKISFRMIFETVAACMKIKAFILPNNEENFDRLERVLLNIII